MATSKRLIVGLGNPGAEYEKTRHNVGFEVVDAVAEKARITLEHDKGDVLLGWGRVRRYPLGVAKPLTYMNRSGTAVRTLLGRHGLEPQEILVVVDDINLPVGKLRLRQGEAQAAITVSRILRNASDATIFPDCASGSEVIFHEASRPTMYFHPFLQTNVRSLMKRSYALVMLQ